MSILHVHAGEVILGGPSDELHAVLGSCVAVSLWHPRKRVGVMCHVLLPRRGPARRVCEMAQKDARFAEDALHLMAHRLHGAGIKLGECVCKLFGGARVFAGGRSRVGNANVSELKRLLGEAGVVIACEHVEGTGHRVIRFVVESGDVWVSHRRRPFARREHAGNVSAGGHRGSDPAGGGGLSWGMAAGL